MWARRAHSWFALARWCMKQTGRHRRKKYENNKRSLSNFVFTLFVWANSADTRKQLAEERLSLKFRAACLSWITLRSGENFWRKQALRKSKPGFANIFRPVDTVCSLLSKVCLSRSSHLDTIPIGGEASISQSLDVAKMRADRKAQSVSQTFRSESIDKLAFHMLSNRLITQRTRATFTYSLSYSNHTHTRARARSDGCLHFVAAGAGIESPHRVRRAPTHRRRSYGFYTMDKTV